MISTYINKGRNNIAGRVQAEDNNSTYALRQLCASIILAVFLSSFLALGMSLLPTAAVDACQGSIQEGSYTYIYMGAEKCPSHKSKFSLLIQSQIEDADEPRLNAKDDLTLNQAAGSNSLAHANNTSPLIYANLIMIHDADWHSRAQHYQPEQQTFHYNTTKAQTPQL